MRRLKVFTHPDCGPCDALREAIEEGELQITGLEREEIAVEFVDVETDEGFAEITKLGLNALPSLLLDGKECRIQIEGEEGEEVAFISCPLEDPPASIDQS